MAEAAEQFRCGKPECEVATTRICAEGHEPPESCPYYRQARADGLDDYGEHEAGAGEADAPVKEDLIPLPAGEALSPAEVDEFLRWRAATFVTIVGDRGSGKTTLIYAIYDRFLKGPFAGYMFAGSRTLIGLEKRSHLARVESGRSRPDTPHTSLAEGLRFFHFAVVLANRLDARADLMLSDRAGEVYRQARSNSVLVENLVEVAKAHRLVLLLDGGRVADSVERAGAMQSVRQALRALVDGGGLNLSSIVQVVTTKIDLLANHAEKPAIDAQLIAYRERLVADFGPRLAELSFWEIAARDPLGDFPPGHGLNTLFADWVTPRPALVSRSELTVPLRSEFDRLLVRTPMQVRP